jgi:hypothetical protein
MAKTINHSCNLRTDTCAAGQRHRLTKAIETSVKAGVGHYERARHLPGLIGIDPGALSDGGAMPKKAILARLKLALRTERRRAKAGHWAYDLNRHIALRQALMVEENDLAAGLCERAGHTERARRPDEGTLSR